MGSYGHSPPRWGSGLAGRCILQQRNAQRKTASRTPTPEANINPKNRPKLPEFKESCVQSHHFFMSVNLRLGSRRVTKWWNSVGMLAPWWSIFGSGIMVVVQPTPILLRPELLVIEEKWSSKQLMNAHQFSHSPVLGSEFSLLVCLVRPGCINTMIIYDLTLVSLSKVSKSRAIHHLWGLNSNCFHIIGDKNSSTQVRRGGLYTH